MYRYFDVTVALQETTVQCLRSVVSSLLTWSMVTYFIIQVRRKSGKSGCDTLNQGLRDLQPRCVKCLFSVQKKTALSVSRHQALGAPGTWVLCSMTQGRESHHQTAPSRDRVFSPSLSSLIGPQLGLLIDVH